MSYQRQYVFCFCLFGVVVIDVFVLLFDNNDRIAISLEAILNANAIAFLKGTHDCTVNAILHSICPLIPHSSICLPCPLVFIFKREFLLKTISFVIIHRLLYVPQQTSGQTAKPGKQQKLLNR